MWRSVARQHTRNSTDIDIAPDKNVISPLVIAVLETSGHKDKALKLAEFISGPTGKEVFEKYHYEWGK